MKFHSLVCIFSILLPLSLSAKEKPNVIVILSDDQGSRDVHCYGAEDLVTPALDSLAERGVKFTQFYAAAPVCGPSRAGLLSGNHPWEVGVPGNVGLTAEGMPSKHNIIAEYFKEAGYATAHIGKWHVGHHPGTLPLGQGFDYSFGHMGGCIDNYSHYFYWNGPNKHDLFENGKEVYFPGQFFPTLMAEKALSFVAKTKQPFFIYYAVNLPHYPYQAANKWIEHYKDLPMPRSLYAAAVSAMDESVGQLIDGLTKKGKLDNTVIVFMSDHGHSTEVRAFGGGGWSGGLRGAKFSLFEGGIRVPAIISYPGVIPSNKTREQIAMACDWLPTLLDFCEIEYDPNDFAGKSLKTTILEDQASPHTSITWMFRTQSAVRSGDWKLIHNPTDTTKQIPPGKQLHGLHLYNLKDDPEESKNLAAEHPEITDRLKALLPKNSKP